MNRVRYRLMAVTVLPFLLALAADLTAYALLHDRLPEPMASHFTGRGHSDDTASRASFLGLAAGLHLGLGAVWGLVVLTLGANVRAVRWMIAAGYATAGFVGYLMVAVLLANAGVSDPDRVRMPLWHIAVGAGVGALGAGIGRLLLVALPAPDPEPSQGPGESPRLDLAEGEAAGWMRRAPSRVLSVVGVALLVFGVVLLLTAGPLGAVGALPAGLLCLAFSRPYVTVDRHGLTARPTVLPWPRIRVPLSDVDRADSRHIDIPTEYGGWGYRFRPGRSGLMLRSGEAIVVRRLSGREFAVTVDDAATAAGLLNTLAHRAKAGR
ncbi:DUF1648 domain-containing protein [Streptomyces sp. NPDC006711]|uniref:DUF1648 domain-containing protein n=1 Tax=Streptomyces sp. NPDC006711 TaxID=3364762 RepID=UPI0036BB35BF